MRTGGPLCNRRLLFDRATGLIAALFYSVFQPWWTWKTLSFDGEMLMNLPIIWAFAIVFRRSSSRLRPELFAAGAFLGAAFLLKQPAAIAAVPLGIYLLLPSYRASRSLTRTNSIIQAATHGRIFRSARSRDDCALVHPLPAAPRRARFPSDLWTPREADHGLGRFRC